MSKFRVGQRVRIKWSKTWPWLAGRTGTITEMATSHDRRQGRDWHVTPDGCESNILQDSSAPQGYARFVPGSDQLEPATDSYDVTTWDQCVWQPEHLRVGA